MTQVKSDSIFSRTLRLARKMLSPKTHTEAPENIFVAGPVNVAQLERKSDGKRILILFDLHTCTTKRIADSVSVITYLKSLFEVYERRIEPLDVFIEMDRFVFYDEKDALEIPDICKIRSLTQSLINNDKEKAGKNNKACKNNKAGGKRNSKIRYHQGDIRVASALMHIPAIIEGYQDLIRASSLDVDMNIGELLSIVMWPIWVSIGHGTLHLENQYIRKQYRKLSRDDKKRFDMASDEVAKRVLKFCKWFKNNIPDPLILKAENERSRKEVLEYLNELSDYISYLSVFYTDLYVIGRMLKTTLNMKNAVAYMGYMHGSNVTLTLQRHFDFKLEYSAKPILSVDDFYGEADRGVLVPVLV